MQAQQTQLNAIKVKRITVIGADDADEKMVLHQALTFSFNEGVEIKVLHQGKSYVVSDKAMVESVSKEIDESLKKVVKTKEVEKPIGKSAQTVPTGMAKKTK